MNTASKPVSVKHTTSPAALEVIWQWLSYASWMWVIGLLGFLTAAVLQHFLVGNNETYGMSEGIIYLVVATAIVTPIAFFVDRTYSRIEPTEKHGFAAVVLALHSVVAFLAFVGVSIAALVALVSMLTEVSKDTKESWVFIISMVVVAKLIALLFICMTKSTRLDWTAKYFRIGVAALAAILVLIAVVGPVRSSINHRTDRFIERSLPALSGQVSMYVQQNKKLPAKLQDITFNEYEKDAKLLANKGIVELKDGGMTEETVGGIEPAIYPAPMTRNKVQRYELCVDYRYPKGDAKVPGNNSKDSTYIDTSSHPNGKVCYNQKVVIYDGEWKGGVDMPAYTQPAIEAKPL